MKKKPICFLLQIFSSLIEASLPPPLAGEEVPSSSALPSPRRIRTQTYQSSPPSSDQPAQRRQFFGAAPVAPFSPFLPPPPPPVPVQKVLSRDSPYLGVPGVDFPAYDSIPATAFSCPGLPDGYYADPEAGCQVSRTKKAHFFSFLRGKKGYCGGGASEP